MTRLQAVTEPGVLNLRVGETVEVLSEAEIMATLDERGELDELPFMPEMLAFCGKRLTVHKVAYKLCDTISRSGMRRMERAVHLTGARCDGSAHGGCQTACLMYWKESWLKRVDPGSPEPEPAKEAEGSGGLAKGRALLPILEVASRKEPGEDGQERYSCQATELLRAAPTCLPLKEFGQYVTDVKTGNASVFFTLRALLVGLFNRYQERSRRFLPSWLQIRGGLKWGFVKGRLTGATPSMTLDLQPGELVRIKPKEEILKTLNQDLLNRGMGFEEEMSRYCGKTARVLSRVDRCIDEKTGRMLTMKSPCIILEDIVCAGAYSVSCPRQFLPFWREIWLERVHEPA
ncbi:hypothetical protein ABZ470_19350 [Streptosporangium sp. NPDC020072]|uniref:hypothetical protein n=1 Tax=Streptosporangium sp. NPDC020072 TaxID=3154788 RepID=UPI00341E6A40